MYIIIYKYFKYILIAALATMIAGVIGYQLTENSLFYKIGGKAAFLYTIMGIYFLHTTGKFIKSSQYRLSRISVSFLIVGILFKIMHWPFSDFIIAFGILLIWAFYLYYMIKNDRFLWSNWLTLLFLITLLLDRYLLFTHLHEGGELMIVSIVFLTILLTNRLKEIKDEGLDKI